MSTVGTICWQHYETLEVTCYHKVTCWIRSHNAQAGVVSAGKLAFYILNLWPVKIISFSDQSQSFCVAMRILLFICRLLSF